MYPDAAGFIHCGDSELAPEFLSGYFAVIGNNDYERYPESLVVTMGTHRALVVHGHRVGYGNRNMMLARQARQANCDLLFYGHSHIFSDDIVDGVRIMNPGSIWRSRDGRGKTYGVFTIHDNQELTFTFHQYVPPTGKRFWEW